MNFRHLETFAAVVKLGSFDAAASRLNSTQSTISSRISELERSLGVLLFDRSQRKAQLTAKGRELLQYAERAVALAGEIHVRIGDQKSLSGFARVGVVEMVAVSWLAAFTERVYEKYPNLVLEYNISISGRLSKPLIGGELDFAIMPPSYVGHEFVCEHLGDCDLVWIASPALNLPDRVLDPSELAKYRVIAIGRSSAYHAFVEAIAVNALSQYNGVFTCDSMSAVAALTIEGLGISLLPIECYRDEIAANRLKIIELAQPRQSVPLAAIYPRSALNTIPHALSAIAREVYREYRAPPNPAIRGNAPT
jgi:DNA-binding transcriptional LysR family regulator